VNVGIGGVFRLHGVSEGRKVLTGCEVKLMYHFSLGGCVVNLVVVEVNTVCAFVDVDIWWGTRG
jgi:hypothetical protein